MALNNVPLAGQNLLNTRDPIAGNFTTIDAAFLVDHVDYNTAGQGKHKKVTFVNNPTAVFLVGEIGLFNKNAAPTNRPDIWLARGTAAAFPMTGYFNTNAGASSGWAYLPSGMKVIWGTATIVAGGQIVITYAVAVAGFPGFSTFWAAPLLTRIDVGAGAANNFVVLRAYNATTMTVKSSQLGNNVDFSWLAFGL